MDAIIHNAVLAAFTTNNPPVTQLGVLKWAAEAGRLGELHETALAALTTLGGAELVAQSTSQATALATATPVPTGAAEPASAAPAAAPTGSDTSPPTRSLAPTMALAIQVAVAAVAAGLIAKSLGNEQSLLVAWTAYVVIAGSSEASRSCAVSWVDRCRTPTRPLQVPATSLRWRHER